MPRLLRQKQFTFGLAIDKAKRRKNRKPLATVGGFFSVAQPNNPSWPVAF